MILPFRISLLVLAFLFTYLFAGISERFLLEVVRSLVPLDSSNALSFNAVYALVCLIPLLIFGALAAVALGGEPGWRRRLWAGMAGMALGMIAFRAYQVWWVFRGGMGSDVNSWTESLSVWQLYFFEKLNPFLLAGAAAGISTALLEEETVRILPDAAAAAAGTALWLLLTNKLGNAGGWSAIAAGFLAACCAAAFCGGAVKRIREF